MYFGSSSPLIVCLQIKCQTLNGMLATCDCFQQIMRFRRSNVLFHHALPGPPCLVGCGWSTRQTRTPISTENATSWTSPVAISIRCSQTESSKTGAADVKHQIATSARSIYQHIAPSSWCIIDQNHQWRRGVAINSSWHHVSGSQRVMWIIMWIILDSI